MPDYSLLPGDIAAVWDTPFQTPINGPAVGGSACSANPTRSMLIFAWVGAAGTQVSVNPIASGANTAVVVLGPNAPVQVLTVEEYGPLVTAAWTITAGAAGLLSVTELRRTRRTDPKKPIFHNLDEYTVPPPRVTLPSMPGVNGGLGIADYWRAALERIQCRDGDCKMPPDFNRPPADGKMLKRPVFQFHRRGYGKDY